MRIAVTGTHGSGKTTLIDDFISVRGDYESVPEPYWLLAQNGMPFADGPTIADLEEQLALSCKLILEQGGGQSGLRPLSPRLRRLPGRRQRRRRFRMAAGRAAAEPNR